MTEPILTQALKAQGEFKLTVHTCCQTLSLDGAIPNLPSLAENLRSLLAHNRVKTIILNSTGGEVITGLRLGEVIRQAGVDVEVPLVCLSSCANYLFTAGRHKRIEPGAVLGFHGDPKNIPNLSFKTDQGKNYYRQYLAESGIFFAKLGFDRSLFAYSVKQTRGQNISFWMPSRTELGCAGVNNVEMTDWDGRWSSLSLSALEGDAHAFGMTGVGLPDFCVWKTGQTH